MASDETFTSVIEHKLTEFIRRDLGSVQAQTAELSRNDSLLDSGILDSLGIYSVIVFIEKVFAVKVDESELMPENFSSIAAIAGLVARKRQ